MTAALTVPEKILIAALELRQERKSFSAEDLVVCAWRLYPDTFGLSGYTDKYPDSNRVFTQIMGTKGLRGKGWLRKIGEKRYSLSGKGLSDGELILERAGTSAQQTSSVSQRDLKREVFNRLDRLLATNAARKGLEGDQNISFTEASAFWDVSARSNANTLTHKFADLENALKQAKEAVEKSGDAGEMTVGRIRLTDSDLDKLIGLHAALIEKFDDELEIIRSRTDERLRRYRKPS
ncbi:hypothetical protein [Roseobacter sp. OBYS 0001]|uniref:hypothetical protein n=1 Tax=Roseobacter sp. OBYS 0001 TaxID=882651 RepID=UPI001BBA57E5|nr:hypothetical protein [Roseobacter sp. OBYS 0001]GIT86160.1 hypothetical protein ROBYS_11760 [Roseobacter sp. OBYS 0001]